MRKLLSVVLSALLILALTVSFANAAASAGKSKSQVTPAKTKASAPSTVPKAAAIPSAPSVPSAPAMPSAPAIPGAGPAIDIDQNPQQMQDQQQISGQRQSQPDQGAHAMQGAGPGMMEGQAITVDNSAIYIVRGSQVIKLDKITLQPLGSVWLVTPSAQAAQGAGPTGGVAPASGAAGAGPSNVCLTIPCAPGTTATGPGGVLCEPAPGIPSGAGPRTVADCVAQQLCQMQPCDAEQAYLAAMARSYNASVAWSELAVERAGRSDLRRFASRTIDRDRGLAQKYANTLGSWYRVRLAHQMTAEDIQVNNTLQTLSGRDFDVAYLQSMLTLQRERALLSRNMASRCTRPQLVDMANDAIATSDAQAAQIRTWLCEWYGLNP